MSLGTDDQAEAPSPSSPSSSNLNRTQATQACKVLLGHIHGHKQHKEAVSTKANLLKEDDDSNEEAGPQLHETPIWLIVTTKKHIVDKNRLKPIKVPVPHSLRAGANGSICLITADPQRVYKDALAHPSFPDPKLSSRVARVIGATKLKSKYKSFESRRQLLAEHDVFLADSRIIKYLPGALGKIFYKGGTKRPIPIEIAGPRERDQNGKRIKAPPISVRKKTSKAEGLGAASPDKIAQEIQKALDSVLLHLAPGVSTAVKVADASFSPETCTRNIESVLKTMTEKLIPQGWKNVRAIHVKGPNTAAFPIWMAGELWVNEEDVLEEKKIQGKKSKKGQPQHSDVSNAADNSEEIFSQNTSPQELQQGSKRKMKTNGEIAPRKPEKRKRKGEEELKVAVEMDARKEKMKERKAVAMGSVGAAMLS